MELQCKLNIFVSKIRLNNYELKLISNGANQNGNLQCAV